MTKEEFAAHMKEYAKGIRDTYISVWLKAGADVYAGKPDPIPRHERRQAPEGMCVHEVPLDQICWRCQESYGTNRCTSL